MDHPQRPPGEYAVQITYACDDDNPGSTYEISAGTSKLTGKINPIGAWDHYTTQSLGSLALTPTANGQQSLTLKPTSMAQTPVMNLKELKLTPAKDTPSGTRRRSKTAYFAPVSYLG